ncbi:methyltransferase domain-containing protein [Streptomyces sp. DT2A-34]|uniref:methyltransferase domain-containing protein n=1 Tax=Streptomyces sp. DT2A-34 TaxID=3051182 RepID=UPI00265BFDB1|nr:methyltransferase domain-containing protein [Streptomyces sp. DT2A-34]MDO0914351.1 methyltransferase domain-containing protein [Streptomyces sp. DT2A-34]
MKASSLPLLRCPKDACEQSSLTADIWAETELPGGERDFVEGVVSCTGCRGDYPIVAGVLLLIENLTAYLKDHLGVILHLTQTPPSTGMASWLTSRAPDHTDARYVRRSMKLEDRYVNAFLGAHYDRTPPAEDHDNPLAELLAATASRDLWAHCATLVDKAQPASALDAGCSVGGLTALLSQRRSRTLGFDTSFLSVLAARRAVLSAPAPLDAYRAYGEGDRYQEHALSVAAKPDHADFVVASALAPTVAEPVELTCAVNLIDLVPDPARLLDTLLSQTSETGHVLITSPYGWSDVARDRRLGGSAEESSPDALRAAAAARGLRVVWEDRQTPWMWRDYSRFWRLYLVDAVLFART